MKKLWEALKEKGKIATLIGFFLSSPVNFWFMYCFFTSKVLTYDQLVQLAVINGIGMVWFILPSSIIIKGGKGFEISIKD